MSYNYNTMFSLIKNLFLGLYVNINIKIDSSLYVSTYMKYVIILFFFSIHTQLNIK